MSFGRELKDFVEGYSKGEEIIDRRETQKLNRERFGKPTEADIANQPGGGLSSTAPAIPESGGGGGAVDNDTAEVAGRLKGDLMRDFKLNDIEAGGIVASLAAESGGFKQLQELNPTVKGSKGGWGYAQWTGPRRDQFNAFAQEYGLDPKSYEANYGFLKHELQGSEGKILDSLRGAKDVRSATQTFTGSAAEGKGFLRPGTPNMAGRFSWADKIAGIQPITRDTGPQIAQAPQDVQTRVAGAAQDPADLAAKLPAEEEPEKQARLSPEAGVAIPDIQTASIEPSFVRPEDEWGQRPVFAATGGVIPEPVQRFATGGAPLPPQPVVPEANPNNPSNVAGGGDKYSSFRNYTQKINPAPAASTTQARRISFPTANTAGYQPMQMTDGLTPSQVAFRDLQARLNAPKPAAAAPVAAPVAAKPAAAAARPRSVPMSVVMPYGNQGGAFGYYDPTLGSRIKAGKQKFAEGGVIPEPEQFARGGAVRDTRFKELERQESRQRSQHSADGGESPRDRAARRLSAEEGRASSTAYSNHSNYWKKAPAKKAGGKPDKTKTSSTDQPLHVRHPPNPKVGKPGPTFPERPEVKSDNTFNKPSTFPERPEVKSDNTFNKPVSTFPARPEVHSDNAGPVGPGGTPLAPSPIPVPAGTPTSGYEPPTGAFPERPGVVNPNGTPRQRYDEEIKSSVPSLPIVESPRPPPQPQGPPASARTALPPQGPPDAGGDIRNAVPSLPIVETPPAARPPQGPPASARTALPPQGPPQDAAEDTGPDVPPQDWSSVVDKRPGQPADLKSVLDEAATNLPLKTALDDWWDANAPWWLGGNAPAIPEASQGPHDPNAAPVREVPRSPRFAAGGVIPEPGEAGYNEAVAGGATVGGATAAPAAAPEPQQRMQPTPQLLSDVGKAIHGGVMYLTRHFGLGDDGAVPTPEGGQAQQDGARRFAEGEGAASQQEVDAIDDTIDPNREMAEGDRAMTRSAKIVQWYLERGRKDEAEAAAAGLMQYGAQKFGQIGSLAAAGYRRYQQTGDPADLEKTTKILQSAYQYIPDGGSLGIEMDPQTKQLVITHTDADGKESDVPLKPEDLPGIIKGVQDKSLYWKQVMTLADPEGARAKEREAASKSEWDRQHGIERGEKKEDTAAAGEAEAAKNERERKETIATEERAAERKAAEDAAKTKEDQEKEVRTNKENDRRRLRDAAITRAEKAFEGRNDIDWETTNPLIDAVTDANSADDVDTDEGKARVAEAKSRLFDSLPEKTRAKDFNTLGYDRSEFKYVPKSVATEGGNAAPKKAPDGKWYVPDPKRPGKFLEVEPEAVPTS